MADTNPNYLSQRVDVPAAFEALFSHFYVAENHSNVRITKTLLPSFQSMMIFSFGETVTLRSRQNSQIILDKCLVLGPIKQAFEYTLPPGAEILVVSFKDDAFYRFFKSPPLEKNRAINPDNLVDESCFTALWQALKQEADANSRVNHILDFSQPYIRQRTLLSEQLSNVKSAKADTVKSLAELQQKTTRTIQSHHKKYLGYSAKEFKRYQRFSQAISQVQSRLAAGSKVDWHDVIADCGYYDQSHLIRDFQYYFQLSPSQYLMFQQDICGPID
jgi:AraC-like DNA-binding protein